MTAKPKEKEFVPKDAVYAPQEVSEYTLEAIEEMRRQKTRSAKLNMAGIRDYFAPMMPGQLCSIIAQTSNGKSMFMHYWERMIAEQLIEDGREDECVIHVSVEEVVEEQGYLELARFSGEESGKLARGEFQDWSKLEMAAMKIATIPIFRIGDSLARAEDMPNLYISNMVKSIRSLVNGEVCNPVKPAAIFFDYLQAFPFDPEHRVIGSEQRRLQVRDDIYRLRMAGAYFKCPIITGVQAKQVLSTKSKIMLPGIYDGEESSSIAQRSDRIITLWMPARTNNVGEKIHINEYDSFDVEENLMFVKVAKQRGGLPAGQSWRCRIDFIKNEIHPIIDAKWHKTIYGMNDD